MRTFNVATYYHPKAGKRPALSHISAYTLYYNASWQSCVEYKIEAANGAIAKALAKQMRLGRELAAYNPEPV